VTWPLYLHDIQPVIATQQKSRIPSLSPSVEKPLPRCVWRDSYASIRSQQIKFMAN
jgi:hypothetical protein